MLTLFDEIRQCLDLQSPTHCPYCTGDAGSGRRRFAALWRPNRDTHCCQCRGEERSKAGRDEDESKGLQERRAVKLLYALKAEVRSAETSTESHMVMLIAASSLLPAHCCQLIAASSLQPAHCCQLIAASSLQPDWLSQCREKERGTARIRMKIRDCKGDL